MSLRKQQYFYNECIMNYEIKPIIPSLLDMALIKIATSLWNESNIIRDIFAQADLRLSTDRVKANIQRLDLPLELRSRLESISDPIMVQISSWLLSTYGSYYRRPEYLHLFYWTSQGTLDLKHTVMSLLRNEEISLVDRLRMASLCCLESEIQSLRERIGKNTIIAILPLHSPKIIQFWMNPNISSLSDGRLSRIMREAVRERNVLAIKYFFPKLTTEVKRDFFLYVLSKIFCQRDGDRGLFFQPFVFDRNRHYPMADIIHFIFSCMDPEYQKALLERHWFQILAAFLQWPWRKHFLEYSKLCLNFFSVPIFRFLLMYILSHRNRNDFSGNLLYYYEELFDEFWMQSPIQFRRFMVNNDFDDLSDLNDVDEDKISLFLKHTSVEERNNIIFSYSGLDTCRDFIDRKQFVLFSRFVGECLPTAESVVHFREVFASSGLMLEQRCRWDYLEVDITDRLKEVDLIFDALLKKNSDEENGCTENMLPSEYK